MKQLLTIIFFLFVITLVNGQQRHAVSVYIAPNFESGMAIATYYGVQYKLSLSGQHQIQTNFSFSDGNDWAIGLGYLYGFPILTDGLFFIVGGELTLDFFSRQSSAVEKRPFSLVPQGGFDYHVPKTPIGVFAIYAPKFSTSQSEFVDVATFQAGLRFRF
ncbi:hypothetical protein E2P86_03480 [Sphingobacterium psychroaquaticum]|uniref:hypothetical protein n=1 Tax=Sphingobacterium psychroaquaticum TaxID=561061 RepID=UPI001069254B|nr:hypothetical protein [Sphingobacterium psychroaquaticum]QBQ40259.1 hypothetical protein E2P86_03480 [Sphingobacterium psychroaquaticum]